MRLLGGRAEQTYICTGLVWPLLGLAALEPLVASHPPPCRHARYYPPSPSPLTDAQLRGLAAPLFLACAERDVWGADRRSLRHAQAVWPPSQLEAVLLPGARHVPGQEAMLTVCQDIVRFFERRGLAG